MIIMPGDVRTEEPMSCETRARNLNPEVEAPDEAAFPQEISRQAANKHKKTKDALFKRGTPNTMIEKDLQRNWGL
jgi:hypothetical protein